MTFRITGLSPAPFRALFGLSDDELTLRGARRIIAGAGEHFPDRIELRDAEAGESLLLVNHTHQPENTPYRASHAVFVREKPGPVYDRVGEIAPALRGRILSLRAFDADHLMVDADLVEGDDLEAGIERFLADPRTAYLHAHYAKRGCYAARIDRA